MSIYRRYNKVNRVFTGQRSSCATSSSDGDGGAAALAMMRSGSEDGRTKINSGYCGVDSILAAQQL
jgi:hypothetical protein